ncbi:MAG: FG-GAP-like repeat-containing protein [Planctomycetota bacterium]
MIYLAPLVAALAGSPAPSTLDATTLSLDVPGYAYGGRSASGDWDGDGRLDAVHAAADGTVVVSWAPALFDYGRALLVPGGAHDAANLPRSAGADRLVLAGSAGVWLAEHGSTGFTTIELESAPCSRVVVLADAAGNASHIFALATNGATLYGFDVVGSTIYPEPPIALSFGPAHALAAVDWNGDGSDDLALAHGAGIEIWRDGTAQLDSFGLIAPAIDLAAAGRLVSSTESLLLLMEFTFFGYDEWQWLVDVSVEGQLSLVSMGLEGYDVLCTVDLDRDESDDVVLADVDGGSLAVAFGQKTGVAFPAAPTHVALPPGTAPAAGHVTGDFDNDGDGDVLAFHAPGGGLLLARGDNAAVEALALPACHDLFPTDPQATVFLDPGPTAAGADVVEVLAYRVVETGGTESIDADPDDLQVLLPEPYLAYYAPLDAWDPGISYVLVLRPVTGGVPGPDVAVNFPAPEACPEAEQTEDPPPGAALAAGKTEGVDPRPRVRLD